MSNDAVDIEFEIVFVIVVVVAVVDVPESWRMYPIERMVNNT